MSTSFKYLNALLEEFFQPAGTARWGGTTGREIKPMHKANARAAAAEFAKDAGTITHREVFRSRLEGCGVPFHVAADIAEQSEAGSS